MGDRREGLQGLVKGGGQIHCQGRGWQFRGLLWSAVVIAIMGFGVGVAGAVDPTFMGSGMQCPNDVDNMPYGWTPTGGVKGSEDLDHNGNGINDVNDPLAVCKRVGVSDGYAQMPNGDQVYLFGFVDLTGVPESEIINKKLQAHLPAPTIEVREGQNLYLTETNLSLYVRPDLFDPHTIHFHGFPHAMAIFDGVPENSIAIPGGRDFTYFYKLNDPGTYPYHCHVEPVEHIQLGMIGTIVVKALADSVVPTGLHYVYNNANASMLPDTRYDVAYTLLIDELDEDKHWNLENIQEGANLWHEYKPNYFIFNGRPYPDTVLPDDDGTRATQNEIGYSAQKSSLITANRNQKILLRLNNLGYRTHTLTALGIPMHVVGEDAKVLRGPDPDGAGALVGRDVSFWKNTYSMAGGKTADIILDTTGLSAGTYFLYARELNSQSNLSRTDRIAGTGAENRGGMITEIRLQ